MIILAESAAIVAVAHVFSIPLQTLPLWGAVLLLVGMNGVAFFQLRQPRAINQQQFFVHLLVDMLALYALLYASGGASNPFSALFIIQVMIAAMALPPAYAWSSAVMAAGFYLLLMHWYVDIPYIHHLHLGDFFNMHLHGMLLSFALLALLVPWFTISMARTIRRQEERLQQAEQLAELGNLAANAAHELGTPLASMALLAESYRHEATSPKLQKRADLLTAEIHRARDILGSIAREHGAARADAGSIITIHQALSNLEQHWQSHHPKVKLELTCAPSLTGSIFWPEPLEQAIRLLLTNAAEAQASTIILAASRQRQRLLIRISDDGQGFPENLLHNRLPLGQSSKPHGMGIGLGLARLAIGRYGGSLTLDNLPNASGARATITIPLHELASL